MPTKDGEVGATAAAVPTMVAAHSQAPPLSAGMRYRVWHQRLEGDHAAETFDDQFFIQTATLTDAVQLERVLAAYDTWADQNAEHDIEIWDGKTWTSHIDPPALAAAHTLLHRIYDLDHITAETTPMDKHTQVSDEATHAALRSWYADNSPWEPTEATRFEAREITAMRAAIRAADNARGTQTEVPHHSGTVAGATSPQQVQQMLDLLDNLIDPDPCWFDHHGGCQAHGYLALQPGERCPVDEAKDVLAQNGRTKPAAGADS